MAEQYRTEVVRSGWFTDLDTAISDKSKELGRDGWRVRGIQKIDDGEARVEFFKEDSSSGGCYITTACEVVLADKFKDDGVELETLRKHRDRIKESSVDFRQVITEYYQYAPKIVDFIEIDPKREEIYQRVYDEIILPTNALLNQGADDEAIDLYYSGFRTLREMYAV